jgi:polyphosphate glucokinase
MKVLMIDIGGSNVKFMNSRGGEMRRLQSGPELSADEMVHGVLAQTSDWEYDCISIGFPGLLHHGHPVREPLNLGQGWINFDYEGAFGKPVRIINDASMQALGNYVHGRLLFMGFGTSIGTSIIADDVIIPVEVGLIRISRKETFVDRLSKAALKEHGLEAWTEAVHEAVSLMQDVFNPRETVLGGGNTKLLETLPEGCRPTDNASAYVGALRLWEDADMCAVSSETTWKIHRRAQTVPSENSASSVDATAEDVPVSV